MSGSHPSERTIQAMVDGELSGDDSRRAVEHCDGCPLCARLRDELTGVGDALRADQDVAPLRPVWPEVSARLQGRGLPRFNPSFAFGAALSVTAGVVLGVYLGSVTTDPGSTLASESGDAATFYSSMGSSLPDVYGLTAGTEEEGS